MAKANGAGYLSVFILGIIMGAMAMFLTALYILKPIWINTHEICGPPAPIFSMLVDYEDIVSVRGNNMIIVHGPIAICFIDPNTLQPPLEVSPGGRALSVSEVGT